jgi:hypothetical protein
MSEKLPSDKPARQVKPIKTDLRPQEVVNHANRTVIQTYMSTTQISEHFKAEPELMRNLGCYVGMAGSDVHWMGGGQFTAEKAVECATMGIPDNVELIKAERRRAERLDVQVIYPSWQADICGAFPDVPSYLAGDPMNMRRLVNQVTETRPVRIFVGMASSCTFSAEQLAKRGALIAALALQLSKTRAVSVYAINSGSTRKHARDGGYYDWSIMVKLPATLSASDMSYWLCHQASVRGLLYACERWFSGPLSWPSDTFDLQRLWGAGPQDLCIGFPIAASVPEAMMLSNPDKWMREALTRLNANLG